MSVEQWRWVPGWEGHYMVSDLGRVRSHQRSRPALLVGDVNGKGYQRVVLYDSKARRRHKRRVHHLVLEAFTGPRPDGMQTRHLNGDPGDNRLVNLCWGTAQENAADMRRHGTWRRPPTPKRECPYPVETLRAVRRERARGDLLKHIAERHDMAISTVWNITKGNVWASIQ